MNDELYQMAKKLKKEIEDLNNEMENIGKLVSSGYGYIKSRESNIQDIYLTKSELISVCNILHAERKNKIMMLEDRFKAL